mgnify:FL=1
MKVYRFAVTEVTTGVLKVCADNYEDAYDKAMCMDGDFFGDDTEVKDVELMNIERL